jgi:ribonuclease P protein component
MSDEAHFPAQQPRPRTSPRVPQPHGDGRRPQEAQRLITLSRRADFLAANRGKRAPMPGFVLLVRQRGDGDSTMRVGFTVTKKIGNAVVRNRMKRRFRAIARALLPEHGVAGADHVLIGRPSGIERDFSLLEAEFAKAFTKLAYRSKPGR